MLDIRLIREKPEFVKERLATRGGDTASPGSAVSLIDAILECDTTRRSLETELQKLNGDRKRLSKEIGLLRAKGEYTHAYEAQVRLIGDDIARLNQETTDAETRQRDLLLQIPNLPHPAAPIGADAAANPVVRTWGEKPAIAAPRSHIEIGAEFGLFDLERAARMSGSAFACYTGQGARLERSLINFMLDLHTREHGYLEVSPPFVIRKEALIGTGQLPKFEEQLYRCERDELYLAPTAEVPVTNLHREEILPLSDLPKSLVAYTPCFRREAGSAGLGTRGLIRVHQFDKVELVKLTTPETSYAALESLTANAERVLQLLGLHYRVIELCTGDLGFGGAKTYDIEVWAPGQNGWLEVSSCTNFEDFQARRLNLRFKDAEGKNRLCHTLNGSGTALPRVYVALLETYLQPDNTILIPKPLHPYFGAEKITKPY
jgi:seryl-tRNA synthetase